MKFLLVLLLAVASFGASAAPACIPGMYGNQVGNAEHRRDDDGRYGVFMCRLPDQSIAPYSWACVHGTCLTVGAFASQFDALSREGTRAAMESAWDENFGNKCKGSTGKLALLCARADKLMEDVYPLKPVVREMAAEPPAPRYAVKPNPGSTTRPVREIVDGKAVETAASKLLRATVDQPCRTTGRPTLASTGTDLWAEFGPDFKPGMVAVCSKR